MMKIFSRGKLILIILSICCQLLAQHNLSIKQVDTSLLKFQKFDGSDGLSQGTIYSSFQDSKGFLWFGTQFGLNRFDGYTYKIFLNNPVDSTSISNNIIYALAEDKKGFLWIGTDRGLNKYDPNKNIFKQYLFSPADSNKISLYSISV